MCAVWREEQILFGYIGGEYSSTDPVTTQKSYQIGLRIYTQNKLHLSSVNDR